jgi:hypothetical protein
MNAVAPGVREASEPHVAALVARLVAPIEVAIARSYGKFDNPTALHGRCFLASAVLAEVLRRHGLVAKIVAGRLDIASSRGDIAPLALMRHAWLRLGKRTIIDSTIVQAERDRWPHPLANTGEAFLASVPSTCDARAHIVRFDSGHGLSMTYTPFGKADTKACLSAPDMQPNRWQPLAREVMAALHV